MSSCHKLTLANSSGILVDIGTNVVASNTTEDKNLHRFIKILNCARKAVQQKKTYQKATVYAGKSAIEMMASFGITSL